MKKDKNCEEYKNAISVEVMRKSDKYTIDNFVPSLTLMYRAAYGVYGSFEWANKKTVIVCGAGNNGGDGYALAGILADNGIKSDICRVGEKFSVDGKYYYDQAKEKGVYDFVLSDNTDFTEYDVVVDCVLGTGFKGEPSGNVAKAIRLINSSEAFVISVDINSGLNGDTGEAFLAVRSNLTVSIGFYKKGLFLGDAPKLIDNMVNVDIGIVLQE